MDFSVENVFSNHHETSDGSLEKEVKDMLKALGLLLGMFVALLIVMLIIWIRDRIRLDEQIHQIELNILKLDNKLGG